MAAVFNSNEAFEMAERIEKNGAAFYRLAANKAFDPEKNQIFNKLANMEDGHYNVFHSMHLELTDEERQTTSYDPDDESALYLRTMADANVFDLRSPEVILKGVDTIKDIYETAIRLEKDSITFYQGIKNLTPKKFGIDKVDAIIKEEMKHISILSRELAKLR